MVTGPASVQTLGAEERRAAWASSATGPLIGCLLELGLEHSAKHTSILILSLATASHPSLSASLSPCPTQRGNTAVRRFSIRPQSRGITKFKGTASPLRHPSTRCSTPRERQTTRFIACCTAFSARLSADLILCIVTLDPQRTFHRAGKCRPVCIDRQAKGFPSPYRL